MTKMEALKKYGANKQCPDCRSCNTFERMDVSCTYHCLSCGHEWEDGKMIERKEGDAASKVFDAIVAIEIAIARAKSPQIKKLKSIKADLQVAYMDAEVRDA